MGVKILKKNNTTAIRKPCSFSGTKSTPCYRVPQEPRQSFNTKQQWNTIKETEKLNSIGPPSRDSEGWMKVWADMKTSINKKLVFNKQQNCGTGGGPFKQKALIALDEAVSGLLQLDPIINPKRVNFGIQNATYSRNKETHKSGQTIDCVETHDSLAANDEDGNSNGSGDNIILEQSRARKTKRHCKASEKQSLLQHQLKIQYNLSTVNLQGTWKIEYVRPVHSGKF